MLPPRLAILASGRGSNAVALMQACATGFIPAEIALVISNRADALVLERAAEHHVPTALIASRGLSRATHETQLLEALTAARIDHLLLAGYMRILTADFLQRFRGAVLNIHPALLPEFPGLKGAERQWQARRKVAGATVEFVGAGVDTGPTLLQGSLVVRGDEGPDGLAERLLLEVEHVIYPRAVRLFLDRLMQNE